ncbi:hypothetical protein ADK86_27315 [Streptomyces sp. NRRL F-5755]|nr:hypothetical protein ADK86_27315 [Streptomyces sp. NRRL F-5755]
MFRIWAGGDIGKEHHHCVVLDTRGERRLSRRVGNDEPELLELIREVLVLADQGEALWAMATDLRRPWEKPTEPNKLTPTRVRRGFRTCTRIPALRLVRRNRLSPVRAGHPARRTAVRHPVMMWAGSSPLVRPKAVQPTTKRERSPDASVRTDAAMQQTDLVRPAHQPT